MAHQSEEERFVEEWIAEHVRPEGYEADRDRARDLAGRCVEAAPYSRDAIEARIGDLTERMHMALTQATEEEMMARDGRTGYPEGQELPIGHKKEALEAEAERARREGAKDD